MPGYDSTDHAEKGAAISNSEPHLERLKTAGGHDNDRTQPALPVVHRSFANPAPLGLLSFATGSSALTGHLRISATNQIQGSS